MAKSARPGTQQSDPAREAQIKANIARGAKDVGAGIVKEEIFGIPGAFADLSGLAQFVTNPFTYGTSEKLQTASEDLIADLGASALAAKAGVELSDEIFDEEGNIRPEMVGRFLAPGALYAKGAALAPGIGRLFAQTTKTRGSGIEVKGSKGAELEAPPSDLEPLPSEKFGDFTTPELITAWTIDQTKVPRAEVAARLKNDPSATARTNEALDDGGYGDTVPVYRYIMLKGDEESAEFVPEGLRSATLDPRQLEANIFFMDKTQPVFTDTVQRIVRYDVPRDRIAGYLPACSDQIKRGVNKAVKERGIGQKKITGTKVVTNPAEHSKTLLGFQDEVIADVSDLEPNFFSSPSYSSRGVVPRDVRENEVGSLILPMVSKGKIDTSGFSETRTALNRLDFGGYGAADDQLEAFEAAEAAARQKFVDEYSEFFNFTNLEPSPKSTTTVAPKTEVLEGEVVGTKSKKYMKLEKEMGEARTPELRAARELNMETQGVEDAFDLNAANNIDKNFEFASGGDDVRATSDEFISGVIDEYQGARDQGFNRGDALVDAIRVKVRDYNEIYPDALDANSVLDDIAKNVNDDFGFDAALSRFREAQTNRKALEAELQTAKFKNVREAQEAATRVREEQLGIADLSDAEKAAFYRNMGEQEQRGIAGIGIPEPETPKPNLRLVKKAKGGPVDMRSGVGDLFRVYS